MLVRNYLTIVLFLNVSLCSAAIQEFVETFDGTGPFDSQTGNLVGLDNLEWNDLFGDWELRDGGAYVKVDTIEDETGFAMLRRQHSGQGDFVERVVFNDVVLIPNPGGFGSSTVQLVHSFGNDDSLWMNLFSEDPDVPNEYVLFVSTAGRQEGFSVSASPHFALEISFDEVRSSVSYSYENFIDDEELVLFGPYDFAVGDSDSLASSIRFAADRAGSTSEGLVDHWSLTTTADSPPGDFNDDGVLDEFDIDRLTSEVLARTNDALFDLNFDKSVDEFDRNTWVRNLRKTWFGDSNLDGEFNSTDLVNVFGASQYEDDVEVNSTWASGDWNGDGDFTSRDLVFAFGDGGYEIGPRIAIHAVPEPTAHVLTTTIAAVCSLFIRTNRRLKRNLLHERSLGCFKRDAVVRET